MERLQKIMAHAGIASRRKCEQMILQGKVKVNGKTIKELGFKADPIKDWIEVDQQQINHEKKVYLLFYKPAGVITSVNDPQGRKVVTDYINVKERVYPVGRLDYNTEGLLLLTNDGELAHQITHPSHEIDKVYLADVKGIPSSETVQQLANGILLEDGWTAPGKARLVQINKKDNRSSLEIVIHEGRNRQVRRMCEAVGYPVEHLKRIKLGFLDLGILQAGDYRHLSGDEVAKLKEIVT